MISPERVGAEAKKRESENQRFRRFLKNHADPDELDRQFQALHKELFDGYDCCKCGNCCREFSTTLSGEEISAIASRLGMEQWAFITHEGGNPWPGTPGSLSFPRCRRQLRDSGLQTGRMQRFPLYRPAGTSKQSVQCTLFGRGVSSGF